MGCETKSLWDLKAAGGAAGGRVGTGRLPLEGGKFRLDRRRDLVKNDDAMLISVTQAVVLVVVVAGDAVGTC